MTKTILLLLLVRIIINHQHSRVRCHYALVSLARCVLYLFVVFTEIRSRVVMFFSAGRWGAIHCWGKVASTKMFTQAMPGQGRGRERPEIGGEKLWK